MYSTASATPSCENPVKFPLPSNTVLSISLNAAFVRAPENQHMQAPPRMLPIWSHGASDVCIETPAAVAECHPTQCLDAMQRTQASLLLLNHQTCRLASSPHGDSKASSRLAIRLRVSRNTLSEKYDVSFHKSKPVIAVPAGSHDLLA